MREFLRLLQFRAEFFQVSPDNLMHREFSAGAVVLRRMGGRWYLAAIEPQRDGTTGEKTTSILALPKGNVDRGEKPDQTAAREVLEETGVTAEMISKLQDIKYMYIRKWGDGERVFKVVSFYLMKYKRGRIDQIASRMRFEVRKAQWVPLDEAPKLLSYKGERQVAKLALEYVRQNMSESAAGAT